MNVFLPWFIFFVISFNTIHIGFESHHVLGLYETIFYVIRMCFVFFFSSLNTFPGYLTIAVGPGKSIFWNMGSELLGFLTCPDPLLFVMTMVSPFHTGIFFLTKLLKTMSFFWGRSCLLPVFSRDSLRGPVQLPESAYCRGLRKWPGRIRCHLHTHAAHI